MASCYELTSIIKMRVNFSRPVEAFQPFRRLGKPIWARNDTQEFLARVVSWSRVSTLPAKA